MEHGQRISRCTCYLFSYCEIVADNYPNLHELGQLVKLLSAMMY